jgi:hypothetical protein
MEKNALQSYLAFKRLLFSHIDRNIVFPYLPQNAKNTSKKKASQNSKNTTKVITYLKSQKIHQVTKNTTKHTTKIKKYPKSRKILQHLKKTPQVSLNTTKVKKYQ